LRNWSLAIDYRETFFAGNIFENTRSTAQRAHPLVQDVSPREARQDPIAEATESTSGMIFFSASFNIEFTKRDIRHTLCCLQWKILCGTRKQKLLQLGISQRF